MPSTANYFLQYLGTSHSPQPLPNAQSYYTPSQSLPFSPPYNPPQFHQTYGHLNQGQQVMPRPDIKRMISEALAEAGVTSKAPVGYDTSKFPHFTLPPGFKMPKMRRYNGAEDPRNHLAAFNMDTLPYRYDQGLIVYLFFKTLEGEALRWFDALTAHDLQDFKTVEEKFLN